MEPRPGREEEAPDVDAHRLVPHVPGGLGEQAPGRRHRVVHQHVESPVPRDRRVDERGDVVGDADVAPDREGVAAHRADRVDGLLDGAGQPEIVRSVGGRARRAHDGRTGLGEPQRETSADPARRPTHDRDLAGEVGTTGVRAGGVGGCAHRVGSCVVGRAAH